MIDDRVDLVRGLGPLQVQGMRASQKPKVVRPGQRMNDAGIAVEGRAAKNEQVRRAIGEGIRRKALTMLIRHPLNVQPVFRHLVLMGAIPRRQLGNIAGIRSDFQGTLDFLVIRHQIRIADRPTKAFVQPFTFGKVLRRKARHRAGPVVGESSGSKLRKAFGAWIAGDAVLCLLPKWWNPTVIIPPTETHQQAARRARPRLQHRDRNAML